MVQSVSPDGRNITFTSPLSFLHYGGPEYQTEVVLLSRNILLQGSPDTAGQRAGGHVRVESKVRHSLDDEPLKYCGLSVVTVYWNLAFIPLKTSFYCSAVRAHPWRYGLPNGSAV